MNHSKMVRMFVGFDQVESGAYHTFEYSIQSRSSLPVSITPIRLSQLRNVFSRDWDPKQSNEFSFSRWIVPYLCDYNGWAIFADCDMICFDDIVKLWNMRDEQYSVMCVKHDHNPTETIKYLGRPQTPYEKKNWSSVMLFNCNKCVALTPDYVNTASGLELHQFKWLEGDHLIGSLPQEWNHLVSYHAPNPGTKIAHFTTGGPYFKGYEDVEFADEWTQELKRMIFCEGSFDKDVLFGDK